MKNKFKDSLKSGTFKVGVMGISTTAGHDCHHNQSYVHVFQRHMQVTSSSADDRRRVSTGSRNAGNIVTNALPKT